MSLKYGSEEGEQVPGRGEELEEAAPALWPCLQCRSSLQAAIGSELADEDALLRLIASPADLAHSGVELPSSTPVPDAAKGMELGNEMREGACSDIASAAGVPPQRWGLPVQALIQLRDEILNISREGNLVGYCRDHGYMFRGGRCLHVCLGTMPCRYSEDHEYGDHRGVDYIHRNQLAAGEKFEQMRPDMHAVVAREVKPRTRRAKSSFALMLSPQGLDVSTFVTHTWEELFDNFVTTVQSALDPQETVFVCSFALDQNIDIKATHLANDDLSESPFAQALMHAKTHLVVIDEELKLLGRLWCIYEIDMASRWGIPMFLWPRHLSDLEKICVRAGQITTKTASASDPDDLLRLQLVIESAGDGFEAMDSRVKACLDDRLRFYSAAVSEAHERLADLGSQLNIAKRNKDTTKCESVQELRRKMFQEIQLQAERLASHRRELRHRQKRQELRAEARKCERELHKLGGTASANRRQEMFVQINVALHRERLARLRAEVALGEALERERSLRNDRDKHGKSCEPARSSRKGAEKGNAQCESGGRRSAAART